MAVCPSMGSLGMADCIAIFAFIFVDPSQALFADMGPDPFLSLRGQLEHPVSGRSRASPASNRDRMTLCQALRFRPGLNRCKSPCLASSWRKLSWASRWRASPSFQDHYRLFLSTCQGCFRPRLPSTSTLVRPHPGPVCDRFPPGRSKASTRPGSCRAASRLGRLPRRLLARAAASNLLQVPLPEFVHHTLTRRRSGPVALLDFQFISASSQAVPGLCSAVSFFTKLPAIVAFREATDTSRHPRSRKVQFGAPSYPDTDDIHEPLPMIRVTRCRRLPISFV